MNVLQTINHLQLETNEIDMSFTKVVQYLNPHKNLKAWQLLVETSKGYHFFMLKMDVNCYITFSLYDL